MLFEMYLYLCASYISEVVSQQMRQAWRARVICCGRKHRDAMVILNRCTGNLRRIGVWCEHVWFFWIANIVMRQTECRYENICAGERETWRSWNFAFLCRIYHGEDLNKKFIRWHLPCSVFVHLYGIRNVIFIRRRHSLRLELVSGWRTPWPWISDEFFLFIAESPATYTGSVT